MKLKLFGLTAAAATIAAGALAPVQADSVEAVEGARAKDRAGYYTSRQDHEKLRRYGGNDDGYGYGYGVSDDDDDTAGYTDDDDGDDNDDVSLGPNIAVDED